MIFSGVRHPRELGGPDVTRFLPWLVTEGHVCASKQNEALSAILFLYREILSTSLWCVDDLVRAKRPARLSSVLGRDEVRAVLDRVSGSPKLMVLLLCGSGPHLLECCRLRVKAVDLEGNQIVVRAGKGEPARCGSFSDMTR